MKASLKWRYGDNLDIPDKRSFPGGFRAIAPTVSHASRKTHRSKPFTEAHFPPPQSISLGRRGLARCFPPALGQGGVPSNARGTDVCRSPVECPGRKRLFTAPRWACLAASRRRYPGCRASWWCSCAVRRHLRRPGKSGRWGCRRISPVGLTSRGGEGAHRPLHFTLNYFANKMGGWDKTWEHAHSATTSENNKALAINDYQGFILVGPTRFELANSTTPI